MINFSKRVAAIAGPALLAGVTLAALSISLPSFAEPSVSSVDKLIKSGERTQQQAVRSQQKIDKLSDQSRTLYGKFQLENKRLEDLNIYNAQLQNQLKRQQEKMAEIGETLKNISVMERQISPLLLRMIQGLDQFVKLDLPFLLDERQERIEKLQGMMNRADVSIAEKFRQVFEAYAIELEYGNTIETYRGTLPSTQKDVEFLRLGRIGLMYQSLDGREIGAWDRETKQWVEVEDRFRRDIRKGLKMAKRQISPDIIKLPVNVAKPQRGQ
ncbi:MAG: DUF3450 domain-containing protein [Pseudomonadales bacterium]|nr:DUF3450 domain-containing protein [Pseudomonadales bacterium]